MDSADWVSVVVPVRDRNSSVGAAIRSVLEQGDLVSQVIVVDNGSQDGTVETVQSLCEADDRVELVHSNRPADANYARWLGVERATSSLVAFQDSDAIWLPGKLTSQVARLKDQSLIATCCAAVKIEGAGSEKLGPRKSGIRAGMESLYPQNWLDFPTLLIRRSALSEYHFDSSRRRFQDWQLGLDLLEDGARIAVESEIRVVHLTMPGAISSNRRAGLEARREIIARLPAKQRWRHPLKFALALSHLVLRAAYVSVHQACRSIGGSE